MQIVYFTKATLCFYQQKCVLQNKVKTNPPQGSTVTLETPVHGQDIWGFLSPSFRAIGQLTLNTRERLHQ